MQLSRANRSTRPKMTAAAAVAAVTLALAACGDSNGSGNGNDDAVADNADTEDSEPITLRYAFYAPQASFPGVQMEEWSDAINERTDGQVEVEMFPGGSLMGAGDIYDGVSQGVIDIGLDSPHNDSGRFPFSSVMNLPLEMPNSQIGSSVYLDLLDEFEPTEFEGFEILTAFTAEPAYILTSREIQAADDVVGLELRAPGPLMSLAEELGIAATSMPTTEVAEAMQTGLLEGTMSSRDVLRDLGLGEHVDYMVDYPFGLGGTFVAVMDAERYAQLPAHVQEAMEALKTEMMEFASTYHDEVNVADSVAWTEEEHGLTTVTLDDADRQAWAEVAERIVQDWVESYADADFDAQEVVDRTRELAQAADGS